jgi:hypothetical protein
MKTNIKMNIFKMALTIAAVFIFTGATAQTPGTAVPGTPAVAFADDGSTYMIEGATIPLYALPDNLYHPNYAPNGTPAIYTLTDGFTWLWSQTQITGTETLGFSQNGEEDNYVALTAPAGSAGTYTVNVIERAPLAWGGCDDGAGTDITINIVAAPALGFGGNQVAEACAGGTFPTAINAIISGGWQNYRLAWNLQIHTMDDGGSVLNYYTDETGAGESAVQIYAEEFTNAAFNAVAGPGNHDIMTVGSFLNIDEKTTVYTYTLTGINDQASRFGNFIALGGDDSVPGNFTYFPAVDTYTVTVLRAPSTGPIYHIPSTWAQ